MFLDGITFGVNGVIIEHANLRIDEEVINIFK